MILLTKSGELHEDHVPFIAFREWPEVERWANQRSRNHGWDGWTIPQESVIEFYFVTDDDRENSEFYNILHFEFGKPFPRT